MRPPHVLFKAHFLIFGLLTAGAFGVSLFFVSAQTGQNQQNQDLKIIALGDSITYGTGTTEGNDYVSILSRRTGIQIENQGVVGDTTEEALERLDQDVLSKNPDIVIVFLGGNDVLQRIPRETTLENLESIVSKIKESGAKVVLVSIYDGIIARRYESGYRDIARDHDAYYTSGVLRGILGRTDYMYDLVHPNDAGHRIIADRIFDELSDAIHDSDEGLPLQASCSSEPSTVYSNDSARWTAFAYGGANSYRYSWQGSDDLSGSGQTISKKYKEPGTKNASVTVTSGNESVTAECSNDVTVETRPITGTCAVYVTPRYRTATTTHATVQWNVYASGGTGSFSYEWSIDDDTDDATSTATTTKRSVKRVYTTPGKKSATVTIHSGDISETLTCWADIEEPVVDKRSLSGSCSVRNTRLYTGRTTTWRARSLRGEGKRQYVWSGDVEGTSQVRVVKFDTPGKKEANVEISDNNNSLTLHCEALIASSTAQVRR